MVRWRRGVWWVVVLAGFAGVPAVACQFLAPAPRDRYIHIESFRYGKSPSVIRCNRGDRLHLTFSTRDAAHSFFLEEFDVDAKISPGSSVVARYRTSDPERAPIHTREVVFVAEHPGWLGWLVAKSQFRCHVWCGPMHAFEHGNLIIEPNTLLFAALGLLVGIPAAGLWRLRKAAGGDSTGLLPVEAAEGWDVFRAMPWLKWLVKRRAFQFVFVAGAMVVFYVVILTTLFGTHMAGRNLGIMLMWVVWLFALTAVLMPLGGRIWCLPCPLPIVGEALQRRALTRVRAGKTGPYGNRFFGLNLRWPRRLSNAWPRTILFLALGTFSTVLVANPRVSAWVVISMVILPAIMAMIWELRAFCRYLCPITAFVGLYSMAGKLALRSADRSVCAKCTSHACQMGNDKGWACPYGLCVAEINENNDCGLCTECIKSCPYDNVSLRWRPFGQETKLRDAGEAFLAMVMLTLAAAYCVVHLGHWPVVRDYVNILDKGNWDLFAIYAAVLWGVALLGLPAVMFLLAALGKALARAPHKTFDLLIASAGALVPIGLMLWIAFVVPMLFVNVTFVFQSLSDPFGWGWDFFGTRNTPWHQFIPRAVPWIQVACILVGLAYSLRNAWRIWLTLAESPRAAMRGMLPIGALLVCVCGWAVWFFAN